MVERMNNKLHIGWGEADITPDGRIVELNGQYYQRVANGVHSRLKVMVLLIKKNDEISAMICMDNLGIPADFAKRIQQAATGQVAHLLPERVIVNAIHTHNAPSLKSVRNWWNAKPATITCEEYQDLVEKKTMQALQIASKNWQESGIATVLDSARIGHCRRVVFTDKTAEMYGDTTRDDFAGMEGGEDSGVDIMFFADKSQCPIGAIVNIACPSQVMEATYMISSDFMGALREKLKGEFGPNFKMLPQISAAGCQAPRDLSRNYSEKPDFWHDDGVEEISNRLLRAVRHGWNRVEDFDYTPVLMHTSKNLPLPLWRVTEEDFLTAKREMEELEAKQSSVNAYKEFCDEVHANEEVLGRPGPYDDKKRHFVEIRNRKAVINRYEIQNSTPYLNIDLHVMRLGNTVFATNPFELFLEYGQRMKARSKAEQTFLIQLANGYEGYLPSTRAEQLGGYGGLIINGKIGSEGGKILVDETVKEIEKLWQ
jgi:hypothetical protein